MREREDGEYDTVDLGSVKRASSARQVEQIHRTPEVRTRDTPRETTFEDEKERGMLDKLRWEVRINYLRLKMLGVRTVQFAGLYLIGTGLFDLFSPMLIGTGLIELMPAIVLAPYVSAGLSPIVAVIAGMIVVWFSTSVWFW